MAAENNVSEQAGIPQLEFSSFPNQILWLVVFLLAIFIVVRMIALPRIGQIVSQREKRIKTDLEDARKLNEKIEGLENSIEETLAEAKRFSEGKAAETRNEILEMQNKALEEAEVTVKAEVAEAEKRIEAIQDEALTNIRAIANEAAVEIVNQIVPKRGILDEISGVVDAKVQGKASE
ncbi:MAG: hypothetical protein F4203_09385 [Rhodobacteraceae bacterium]|nr:hypothetical protein [Paracoccaceae bacterium]MDE2738813.1 hypothetical protein [Paracoccaceae bacterium]MDE2759085.1 hypothetical protein [Paracoccaceae bacterium]MDE2916161.1 hypothetical protein [Paracoccaceae bacterium]MYE36946.1 hypothetical protein [Paracoccaceae bacterium]